MNCKKSIAIALALVMAISCITVTIVPSDDSDAVAMDIQKGDAWGFGGSMGIEELLDVVNEIIKEDKELDLIFGELTKENYLERINLILSFIGSRVDDFSINSDVWYISEVIEKNDNGYIVDLAMAAKVDMTLSGTFAGELVDDSETGGPDLTVKDLVLGLRMSMGGKAYLDKDFALTGMNVDYDISSDFSLETNVVLDDDDELELTDALHAYDKYIILGGGFDVELFNGKIHLLPVDGNRGWTDEFDARITMNMNIATDITDDDGENLSKQVHETEIVRDQKWKVDVKDVDGTLYMYPQMDMDDLGIPDISMIGYYTFPFEDDDRIPGFLMVGDDLKLDSAGKDTVRNGISKIDGGIHDNVKDMVFTVTFLDMNDKVLDTQKVKYGGTVTLPTKYDGVVITDDDGEKEAFVGWETDDDVIWKAEFPVKSDMTLEPEFADVVSDDKKPGAADFNRNPNVIWDLKDTSDAIHDAIDNSLIQGQNTLYISITDADGNLLYKWKLNAGNDMGTTSASIIPEIEELETPDRTYLKDVADGRTTMYLDFKASGTMPGNTTVTYVVGDRFADGSTVTIYYDDTGSRTAEYAGTAVVSNGTIDIDLAHCSSYMIVGDEGSSDSGTDMTTLAIIVVAVIAVIAVAAFAIHSRKNTSG